jgi:Fe-S cluster biogenesis protein NfuA
MEEDELVKRYRTESSKSITDEAELRLNSMIPMKERIRLRSISLKELILKNETHIDLIPALFERLGPVRSALDGHGGGIVINKIDFEDELINFILTLNGSCIACGAAPGTLVGIKDDLEKDQEINTVYFDNELLETFDDLSKEFLISQTNILFKST